MAAPATGSHDVAVQRPSTNLAASVSREAIAVQQIAAPTFDEGRRAAYIQNRFTALPGIAPDSVEIDPLHNVYARLPGDDPDCPAVLVAAHTDTVFDANTDLTIQQTANRVTGPGIGDNSLGVAALLALPGLLHDQPRRADIWLVANTREEGLGDLGGIRAVLNKLRQRVGVCILIEGMAYGQIYHAGIAVRRLRILTIAPGGHSWLHFGQPSAIHELVQIAARITRLNPSTTPRTTFNIGLIEGGRSVNSIATEASMTLDLRSEDTATLAAFEQAVRACCTADGCEVQIEVVGDRPAGSIPVTHPLAQAARKALEITGTSAAFRSGSTDANWPLACGVPAVAIGITNGGNAHRLDEFIDIPPIRDGVWQLALLTLAAANGLG
ncbi:MAG: M20/M25/M40 family metallo-hydrolase [Aggregatilineales bacterium]